MIKRSFIGDDIFKAVDILNKVDLDFTSFIVKTKSDATDEEKEELKKKTVANVMKQIIKGLPKAKNEVNDLLGGLCEITAEEMGKLPLKDYIGAIKELVEHEDFLDFLEQVGQLIK